MSTVLGIGLIIIGLAIVFAILYKKSVIDKKISSDKFQIKLIKEGY